MFMNIPEDIADRLNQLAQQEGATVEDVLKTLLDQYMSQPRTGTLADLAQNARDAELASVQSVDTAERSRDILNTEYADYLKRRMNEGADGDSDRQ